VTYDVITMGRVGVDMYPLQVGVGLEDVETFTKHLGGSPTNVAVATARYGRSTAVISRTGPDPFGRFVHAALREYGVDDRFVTEVPGLKTPVTFCEIFPPDHFPIHFYRFPRSPDLEIHDDELDLAEIRQARAFWATVTGLCREPSRHATLAALQARSRQEITILDLDYRAQFWSSPENATRWVGEALKHATIAIGTVDECEIAVGEREPGRAAKALLARGVELAVVKLGAVGLFAAHTAGTIEVSAIKVDVVNALGAGDAFGGALCHGLLAGWDTPRALRFAAAAGAYVAARRECSAAMPTADEVARLLDANR
jgi:5-dehydro-2-deoxygluconokinase